MAEYLVTCWNCAQEFDALSVQWCGCSATSPTKVCPYCYTCMCKAPEAYKKEFWKNAPKELLDEMNSFKVTHDKLGDLLVKQKLITQEQLIRALKMQKETGMKLGKLLIKMKYVDENDIGKTLSQQFGIMNIDLENVEIDSSLIDDIGIDLIKKYHFIPLEKQELVSKKMVSIAVIAPLSPEIIDKIQNTISYTIYQVLAQDNIFQQFFKKITTKESHDTKKARYIQQAKAMVNAFLIDAIKRKASDIIFQPEEKDLNISYRIGGKLFLIPSPPEHLNSFIIHRLKRLGKIENNKLNEQGIGTDGRFRVKTKNRGYEFIIALFPTPTGERINVRVISETSFKQKLSKLILDPVSCRMISNLLKAKKGILFILGPSGSGKSMTLYSLLQSIEDKKRKIISIENPLFVNLHDFIQYEWKPRLETPYSHLVKGAIDEYPDILALSDNEEDKTTSQLIFQAAREMLVIVNSNALSPSELLLYYEGLNIKKENFMLINAFINQRLLPSLCQNCREKITPEEDDFKFLELAINEKISLYRAKGCDTCAGLGYSGYVPLVEVTPMDSVAKKQLIEQKEYLWLDNYQITPKARRIKRLVIDLVIKGWLNIEDARNIFVAEDLPIREIKPHKSDENELSDTDSIALIGE